MNTKLVVFFLTIFVCTIADDQNVLELTDDEFLTRMADIDTSLVMFYGPECTFCNPFKTELAKASELLSGSNPKFGFVTVNCEEGGTGTCSTYAIDVYPTFKIFRRNQIGQDYNGLFDAASFAKFLRNNYGPPSTELFTLADIEDLLKIQEEATIIGFFESESDLKTLYFEYADLNKRDYRFAHTSAVDVLAKYKETNSIVFFRDPQFDNKFEPRSVSFKGNSAEELTALIKRNYHGLVGHRTRENFADFEVPYVIAYYAVDFIKAPKQTNYWRNRILKVAKDYSSDYTFAISNDKIFKGEMNQYGWGYAGEKPVIAAVDKDNRKFKMTAEFSVENLQQFMSDVTEGKLEPFILSEPIPDTNDEPVKIAVAKNFNEIVIKNDKDTFVEFYAPWCGYCNQLEPVIQDLAKTMLDEDVVIVKFDATANEVPKGFEISSFPTFYWLGKNSKHRPVLYTGGKKFEDFVNYISGQATDELKNYDRSGDVKKSEL